jgi:hypothetical protein
MELNHLSDRAFEELTYDLLVAIGLVNVNWRRGSGDGGASADQGRDIVAQELRKSVDHSECLDTWFVQCKHHAKAVPPEKLQGALTWANSERPHVLLFVISNFLSNPAKNYLESYNRNNSPAYRIKVWERKEVERLLASHPALTRKYGLDPADPSLTAHPAHLLYVLAPPFNTLPYFLEQLEKMTASMRDDVFSWSYHSFIGPRFRNPEHRKEKVADMQLDPTDFSAFRTRLNELEDSRVSGHVLIQAAVNEALSWTWRFGDESQVAGTLARNRDAIAYFQQRIASAVDPDEIESLQGCIATATEAIETAHERQRKWQKYYLYLCQTLLPALAMEKVDMYAPDIAE